MISVAQKVKEFSKDYLAGSVLGRDLTGLTLEFIHAWKHFKSRDSILINVKFSNNCLPTHIFRLKS